jgi:hypothetical protein
MKSNPMNRAHVPGLDRIGQQILQRVLPFSSGQKRPDHISINASAGDIVGQ